MKIHSDHEPLHKKVYWGSVILLGISVGVALYAHTQPEAANPKLDQWKSIGRYVVTFWTLYPPVWMSYEWWRFAPCYQGDELTYFKEAQTQTRTMWLAVVLALSVLFRIDIFKV